MKHAPHVTAILLVFLACGDSSTTMTGPEARAALADPQAVAMTPALSVSESSAQLGPLYQLQAAFHGALNAGDANGLRDLWAQDATVNAFGNTYTGPDEIVGFFENSGPFVNRWASLAPAYKTVFQIHGNSATYEFECVYVQDESNLTGNSVTAHLNATGTMRKVGNRWVFQTFQAGAGSL